LRLVGIRRNPTFLKGNGQPLQLCSIPTGDHKNGAPHAVITPAIAYGKGVGNFGVQGTNHDGIPTVRFPF
jgi:hypothetical protein